MTARALLEELRQAGLSISVTAEGLRVDGPAAVREAFREKIRTHKQELIDAIHEEVGGWLLLHKLWEAGYSLRLQPSEYGPGYVLIPTGKPARPVGNFPALFELYDNFHDSAVALLLDACRLLKIDPVDWPKTAERFVREAILYAQERELA